MNCLLNVFNIFFIPIQIPIEFPLTNLTTIRKLYWSHMQVNFSVFKL